MDKQLSEAKLTYFVPLQGFFLSLRAHTSPCDYHALSSMRVHIHLNGIQARRWNNSEGTCNLGHNKQRTLVNPSNTHATRL